jgi:glycosyltransferase involved in cell wall biosynthesis
MLVEGSLASLRVWDRVAADRADAWISTSRLVKSRIARFYAKPSIVIPPPVTVSHFTVGAEPGSYFLMLMRLVGLKRPEIVVEACTRLGLPLVVAGDGRDAGELRRLAGQSVRFVGSVDDGQMRNLYRDCKALILPSEEDFGITPLEAMAAGRPVVAYGHGGVLDTVVPGRTGLFFEEQSVESLTDVLTRFDPRDFDPAVIRNQAEQFDSAIFAQRMRQFTDERVREHLDKRELEERSIDGAYAPAAPAAGQRSLHLASAKR